MGVGSSQTRRKGAASRPQGELVSKVPSGRGGAGLQEAGQGSKRV